MTGDARDEDRARALWDRIQEPPRHLDVDEELAPYLEGSLDAAGVEIVESHLEGCATCRAEADDLRRVIARPKTRRWVALAVAASLAAAASIVAVWMRPQPVSPPRIGIDRPVLYLPPTSSTAEDEPWKDLIETTLTRGRLPLPAWIDELRSDVVLRGGVAGKSAVSPNGIVVESVRPRFTWLATKDASYTAFIYEGERAIENSGTLRRTEWTPSRALVRGRTYAWQVETRNGSSARIEPAPAPAIFRVAAAREYEDLEKARAEHPDDALLLAVLAARAGLFDASKTYLARLSRSDDPRVRHLAAVYEASPSSTNGAQ